MAILEIRQHDIVALDKTTMADQKLRERADLQRLLRASIHVISADLMIIAEEFGNWQDSRRRIDLLALDRDANLVVIELKRTEDGGHMELQALRYAAMTSVMTFDQAVDAHRDYLDAHGKDGDPREAILEFLEWEEPDDEQFGQDVRVVLVSMDFSKEVTTTVLWLNQKGLDIRCVRLTPYTVADRVLLDVQQIIPLSEAAEFQTKVRQKAQSRSNNRRGPDTTRYILRINGVAHEDLGKRHAVLQLFKSLAAAGVSPSIVAPTLGNRNPDRTIRRYPGNVDSATILKDLEEKTGSTRGPLHPRRWFYRAEDLIRFGGDTYIVSTQWGQHTERFLRSAAEAFPEHRIEFVPSASDGPAGVLAV